MPPEKPVKPAKSSFTDEQIRVKAYQLWEKNKEQSPEENWKAAVKALEKERFWRPLISVWRWTGIGEKKGWDIFTGLSLPLIVFGGGILFNYLNGQQQQKIAEEKQKDELLKTYINDMKASLLDKDYPLKDSKKNSESRSIARTITLTTLTQLNSEEDQQKAKEGKYNQRKGLIMQFLFESGLIKGSRLIKIDPSDPIDAINPNVASIISLNTADLTFANLNRANLESANLYDANLFLASLYYAYLKSANLFLANLNRANLESANLYDANLFRANLGSANLLNANLESANLGIAYLQSAYLESANLFRAKNLTNKQIKSACSWEKAIYTESIFNDENELRWIAKDPKANQRKIDEIKQDKASDPPTPPDCSMWNIIHF